MLGQHAAVAGLQLRAFSLNLHVTPVTGLCSRDVVPLRAIHMCQLGHLCVITLECLCSLCHIFWHRDLWPACGNLRETLLAVWWGLTEVDLLDQMATVFHF